jgi:hypothetical protein
MIRFKSLTGPFTSLTWLFALVVFPKTLYSRE